MTTIEDWVIAYPDWENREGSRPEVQRWSDTRESILSGWHTGEYRWTEEGTDARFEPGSQRLIRYSRRNGNTIEAGPPVHVRNDGDSFIVADGTTDPKTAGHAVHGTEVRIPRDGTQTVVRRGRLSMRFW